MSLENLIIRTSNEEIRHVKSLQITKRLDALTGSFSFQCASEPQLKILADPFTEVDIFAAGQVLLSGFIDRQTLDESSGGQRARIARLRVSTPWDFRRQSYSIVMANSI